MPHKYKTVPEQHPFYPSYNQVPEKYAARYPVYAQSASGNPWQTLSLWTGHEVRHKQPVRWDTAGTPSSYSLYSPVPPHLHVSIHPEKDWLYFPAAKAGRYQSEPTGLKSNLPDGCHNPCSILPVN